MSDPRREDERAARARRGRNMALAVVLALFVIVIFLITVARISSHGFTTPFP